RLDARGPARVERGSREPLAQPRVQQAQLRRPALHDRIVDLCALLGRVRHREEGVHGPPHIHLTPAVQLDERRVDAVQRGARDHADDLHGPPSSPTTLPLTPPAASRRARASSASRPSRPITIAVFTWPPDASSSPAAAGRSIPSVSIRMRWPRSRSFSQVTWRSTIKLP